MTRKPSDSDAGRYHQTHRHVLKKPRTALPHEEFASGQSTRLHPAMPSLQTLEIPMGENWALALRLETLGRNLYNAGGLELVRRITLADMEIANPRTKTREHCNHHSVVRYADVGVCSACLMAVDRMI